MDLTWEEQGTVPSGCHGWGYQSAVESPRSSLRAWHDSIWWVRQDWEQLIHFVFRLRIELLPLDAVVRFGG